MIRSKHALVTGGAGFIGSHLVDRLLADGHRVTVIDDFSNGTRSNLDEAARQGRLNVEEANVWDFDEIAPHFEGVDWVFHLAARADIVPSIVDPMVYHRSNVDGTLSVLEAARGASVKRFLYIASSTCYGLPDSYPTPETAPARPMFPYALTKYVAEQYVLHWHRTYGLPVVSIRLFNVFGTRHRTTGTYGAVFGVFLAQKLAGEPYTVVGDGTQTRDFTYVSDTCQGLIATMCSDIPNGEAVNIGSGQVYSVQDLVATVAGIMDKPNYRIEIDPARLRKLDINVFECDYGKLHQATGWRPTIEMRDGLRMTIDWFNAHGNRWSWEDWTEGAVVYDSSV